MTTRRFKQVDVFSEDPCGGNPVAVVLDGEGLSTEEMQRFASWTNLSETTFVSPPTREGADYAVRIFTGSRELTFAGHPTLGTCHAWLEAGGTAGAADVVVQECGAGLVPVRRTAGDGGHLAFEAPPLQRSGPVEPDVLAEVVRALGIAEEEVVDAEWLDNGPGWVGVLLATPERVLSLRPLSSDLDIGVAALGGPGDVALEVRAFFPFTGGVMAEDPVTGSLNAGLAGWLLGSGRLTAPYVARQGTALGRTGRAHIAQGDGGAIWVGGATTTVLDGSANL